MKFEILNENLIADQLQIKVESFHNPAGYTKIRAKSAYNRSLAQRPRISLGRILSKNLLDKLVRPTHEFAK